MADYTFIEISEMLQIIEQHTGLKINISDFEAGNMLDELFIYYDGLKNNIFEFIRKELLLARSKFPDNVHLMNALTEEVGELSQALLHLNFEPDKNKLSADVYREAIQVAVMAIRVATEGDCTLPAYNPKDIL